MHRSAHIKRKCCVQTFFFQDVAAFVREQSGVSISLIQMRFFLAFNRAADCIDRMEREGIIGPAEGGLPRKVFKVFK